MARVKPKSKLPQLVSWDEVDLALCEIGEHQRAVATIEANMQQQIADAKLTAKDQSEQHTRAIDALSQQIREYAERNREGMRKKTMPLLFGNIGWRKSTKLALPRDAERVADIVRMLRAVGWMDCIKMEPPKINKEALRTHPLEEVVKLGVSVVVEDEFWLETTRDTVPAGEVDG